MERVQEVLFQDLKNDSAMGKEDVVISDPDSTTNKGDPQSQRQRRQRRTTTARLPRDESAAGEKEKNYCSPTEIRVSSKEKLLLAYQETSQQQEEKLLLAYQETSQQGKT